MKKMVWGEDPEFSGPRNYFRESLMIREVRKYTKHGRVLDFGCGSGSLLRRLYKFGYQGVGVDISKSAISYAKSHSSKNICNEISFIKGDEQVLYKKEMKNKFTILMSGETLEHLKYDQKIIDCFHTILKRNGICVVSVPANMKLWDINDDFSSHFRRYSFVELSKKFEDAGFHILKIYYWGFPLSYYWHKLVYLPLVRQKMKGDKKYSSSSNFFGIILGNQNLKQLFSLPFWIDTLFNWTRKGGGLILVAQK